MKQFILANIIILFSMTTMAQHITLPKVEKSNSTTLMQALENRHTGRDYQPQALSAQQLSNLLWCANGINRKDGKRTAPSARNCQEIDIYALTAEGIYLYLPEKHILEQVKAGDFRAQIGMQPFTHTAPLLLVYVANYGRMKDMDDEARNLYGATDCGNVCQNVYLYCAAAGLETVELGSIRRDAFTGLVPVNGKVILGQAVGMPK